MTEDKNIQPTDENEDVEGHKLGERFSRLGKAEERTGATSSRIGERFQHSDDEDDDVEGHSLMAQKDRIQASENRINHRD